MKNIVSVNYDLTICLLNQAFAWAEAYGNAAAKRVTVDHETYSIMKSWGINITDGETIWGAKITSVSSDDKFVEVAAGSRLLG
jgi:uncharacterized membrane protein